MSQGWNLTGNWLESFKSLRATRRLAGWLAAFSSAVTGTLAWIASPCHWRTSSFMWPPGKLPINRSSLCGCFDPNPQPLTISSTPAATVLLNASIEPILGATQESGVGVGPKPVTIVGAKEA